MEYLLNYHIFENNIKSIEFPYIGDPLNEKEISFIRNEIGAKSFDKIWNRLTIVKEDNYYYVKSVTPNDSYYYYMVYDGFRDLVEYFKFRKYLNDGDGIKYLIDLISKSNIDLSFDDGLLLMRLVCAKLVHFNSDLIEAIKKVITYDFTESVLKTSIDELLEKFEHKNRPHLLELVKLLLDKVQVFYRLRLNSYVGQSIRYGNSDLVRIFVESKHFDPDKIETSTVASCVIYDNLEALEILLENGVVNGLEYALYQARRVEIDTAYKNTKEIIKCLESYKKK